MGQEVFYREKNLVIIAGIIGDPVSHSLSPAMHNAAFAKMRLPGLYLPFHVKSAQLASFLKQARAWNLAGLNVTIPHKEKVMKYLDTLSPEAKSVGAVNTVVFRRGRIQGFNTDAEGYCRSLRIDAGLRPKKKRILVLGAGGAARAVVYGLARDGAKEIFICNRTLARARRLAEHFQKQFPKTNIEAVPLKTKTLARLLPGMGLLVNATSIGLDRTNFQDLPLSKLPKKAVVSDLVYKPLLTPLLKKAKKRGLKIHTGLGMLLHQGALSYFLWTGRKPDLKIMRQALLDALS